MSHTLSDELKPCPFCGWDKNIGVVNERHDHSGGYYIACPPSSSGKEFAIAFVRALLSRNEGK